MAKNKKTSKFRDNLIARGEEARTVRKIVAIIIISLILILVIGGFSGYKYITSALQPVDPENEQGVPIEIPMGSSTSDIAKILEENGIIKDGRIFRFYIKFKNESNFQAGEYTFTQAMTIDQIIESLKTGKIIKEVVHKVTIPEGKTIEEMGDIFANKLGFTKEDFIDKANDRKYIEQLITTYPSILSNEILGDNIRTPLEGYLFAATYDFYEDNPSVESVIGIMLDKTAAVIQSYKDEIEASEFSLHEIITFASLVEKEASTEDQRKKIAGVFYNRLQDGMKLQTDPTVLYALGVHKGKVLLEDLEVESPYNTYMVEGLPVGPIANFGSSSLDATLHPEESNYLYFLHDEEGNIFYAETHEEHLKNKQQYIK